MFHEDGDFLARFLKEVFAPRRKTAIIIYPARILGSV
jgi:hypothetical protein